MKTGLIGLPETGKTTLFNLLIQADDDKNTALYKKFETSVGIAKIPDSRIDFLSSVYKPKKTIYATIEVSDVPGIVPGDNSSRGSSLNQFLESVRQVDALIHVVRVFNNDGVIHTSGSIDPMRDIETVNLELLFADLSIIENRIKRIETGKKIKPEHLKEMDVLKKCREALENETLISSIGLSEEEKQYLKSFDFFTERPMILVINMDDEQFKSGNYDGKNKVVEYAKKNGIPLVEVCAKMELEINQLDEEDRKIFLEDVGITESGISKLANAVYERLGLISFLTVGEDEVRAWPIKKGINAKAAGGKIHSDIERGFIRAEVVAFSDFYENGSMAKVKEKGLFRLEGKEYIVNDGDIINFRFNV